jgi:hypothetical protein
LLNYGVLPSIRNAAVLSTNQAQSLFHSSATLASNQDSNLNDESRLINDLEELNLTEAADR